MMPPDGRRLLRAAALGFAVFLFVGSGVGFALAASQDDGRGLSVPAPRPGDRATYSVTKTLLPDLELGGRSDIMLDEVIYEWLPERTVRDRSFVDRLSQPLQVTYIYRWSGQETRYTKVADYDAVTGEPFHTSMSGQHRTQPLLLPGVIGYVGAGVDPLLQPPTDVRYSGDYYAWFMAVPCAQRTPLHGAVGETPATLELGGCGWPAVHDPTYAPHGWEELPTGRAYRFDAHESPLLHAWYDSGSPFPAKFTAAMRETVDPAWTIGRLFTLERTAWARGTSEYPVHEPLPTAPGNPIPLAPRQDPWMMDDDGLGGDLPLPTAYHAAEAAPRAPPATGTGTVFGTATQPSVREWLAAHPDGYLADAERWENIDRYGQPYPGWSFLWVDGIHWLGKTVTYEASVGDGTAVYLPDGAPERLRVRDWTPRSGDDMLALSKTFPSKDQLPALMPRGVDVAQRFLGGTTSADSITYYGFRWACEGLDCLSAGAYVWAGQSTSTYDPNTGATGGSSVTDSLSVDGHGLALSLYHKQLDSAPVLGLGAPSKEETPAPKDTSASAGAWMLPSAPATATGISVFALLVGALYYFWPTLKGLPVLGLFSRIRDDRVLDHPARSRVMEAVRAEPGVHFQELSRRLGLGHGVLEHHLRKLVDAEIVVMRRSPGYTCYFPKATDRRVMDAAPMLRSGGGRAVLGAVAERPGASSRDLAVHLGLAPSTVSYHLKRLETAGLVLPDPRAGVRLTPLGEQAAAA